MERSLSLPVPPTDERIGRSRGRSPAWGPGGQRLIMNRRFRQPAGSPANPTTAPPGVRSRSTAESGKSGNDRCREGGRLRPAGPPRPARQNDNMPAERFLAFLTDAFRPCCDAVLPAGAGFYIAHADTEGLAFRTAVKAVGWKLASCLIWRKDSLVLGRGDYHGSTSPSSMAGTKGLRTTRSRTARRPPSGTATGPNAVKCTQPRSPRRSLSARCSTPPTPARWCLIRSAAAGAR